jgi:hypothetical protein
MAESCVVTSKANIINHLICIIGGYQLPNSLSHPGPYANWQWGKPAMYYISLVQNDYVFFSNND